MTSILQVTPDQTSRLAEIGELTALAYLADGLVDPAHPYVPELKDAAARAQHAILLMMTEGADGQGTVLGTITVVAAGTQFSELAQEGEFELRMLAVSPLARGKGVGRTLATAAIERARQEGASRIVLSTMENMTIAHGLYERLGFVREESRDWTVSAHEEPHAAVRLLAFTRDASV